jgi:2-polyprenyl-6-methoxyphenol hydroxylase-like FAD-dependent oxidoreductase
MVIVGDAAHAASPSSGQGASMAIEDGVVLATCLRDVPDTAQAFRTYTSLRRQRVERVVRHGKRGGDGKALGPVGARIRDLVMPVIMRRMAAGKALDWMYDYRIDWDATPGAPAPADAGR